jgi:hypothetical protein
VREYIVLFYGTEGELSASARAAGPREAAEKAVRAVGYATLNLHSCRVFPLEAAVGFVLDRPPYIVREPGR